VYRCRAAEPEAETHREAGIGDEVVDNDLGVTTSIAPADHEVFQPAVDESYGVGLAAAADLTSPRGSPQSADGYQSQTAGTGADDVEVTTMTILCFF